MARLRHIAISGAGVVGLACALELRRRGLRVTVFEAGHPMREASWAAGGMLAVDDPENPPALRPLSRYSRSLYEAFLAQITSLSGLPVPLRTRQTLQVVRGNTSSLGTLLATPLAFEQALQLVPGLVPAQDGGRIRYLLLEEASLDPRDLCAALPAAARAAGVDLRDHQPVERVDCIDGGVRVSSPRSSVDADVFLNCSGAWAGLVSGSTSDVHSHAGCEQQRTTSDVTPCKGQMLVVGAPAAPPLTCVLRSPEVYLIPRGDGRIAIGATVEDAGFSKSTDAAALELLRRRAAALWPPIADAPLLECWAGLRPATADGLPLLGMEHRHGSSGLDSAGAGRRWIAAGHYRNGILLAPGTAACMAALLAGETPPVDVSAFAPDRMQPATVCDNHFAPAL